MRVVSYNRTFLSESFTRIALIVGAMLLSIGVLVSIAPASVTAQAQVVLDGAKTPERFPEWYRWETVFEALAASGGQPNSHPQFAKLKLSEKDYALLMTELKRFQESKELLKQRLAATKATLQAEKKSGDQILDASYEHEFTYRQGILDARARLLDALPPDSLGEIQTWINTRLTTTKVFLSGRGLANFGRPW